MEPVYKTFPGWKKPTYKITSFEELPAEAKRYLDFIAEELDCPVAIVSVGQTRDKTIILEDPIHGPKRVLSKAVVQ
jgi:adenylosuccinate synthase